MNADELRKTATAAKQRIEEAAAKASEEARNAALAELIPVVNAALLAAADRGEMSYEKEFQEADYLLDLAAYYRERGFIVTDVYRYPSDGPKIPVLTFDWEKHD